MRMETDEKEMKEKIEEEKSREEYERNLMFEEEDRLVRQIFSDGFQKKKRGKEREKKI